MPSKFYPRTVLLCAAALLIMGCCGAPKEEDKPKISTPPKKLPLKDEEQGEFHEVSLSEQAPPDETASLVGAQVRAAHYGGCSIL